MSPADPPRHLAVDRLSAPVLDEDEMRHEAVCVTCRAERRLRLSGDGGGAPVRVGPYLVLGQIGSGAMGRVLAVRGPDGGVYALKRMVAAASRARFAREVELQLQLRHPNVLPVTDVVRLPDGPAMVMPLVEGPTLATLLERDPPPLGQRLALFRDLVAGVAAVHAAGFVHRDLKPQNVLLDAGGEAVVVRVADFGLAKGGSRMTRTREVFGTPAYMAPEQRRGAGAVDARADVWSLGVILFELLTARRAPPTEAALEHLPSTAWGVLTRRLLREEPGERPVDAGAVWAALPDTDPIGAELVAVCRWLAPVPKRVTDISSDPTLGVVPNNLPAERDRFIERDEEAELAAQLSSGARLVTVVGPEGIGKTRLVLAYARMCLEEWPGGIWFCDASRARDPRELAASVASALGADLGTDEPVGALAALLRERPGALVVLDGPGRTTSAEDSLGRWILACSDVSFVATATGPLGVPGEVTLRLRPFDAQQGAALFVDRAAAVREDFAPTEVDRRSIEAIVARLGGIPAAIERAAARTHVMSPAELLETLDER